MCSPSRAFTSVFKGNDSVRLSVASHGTFKASELDGCNQRSTEIGSNVFFALVGKWQKCY